MLLGVYHMNNPDADRFDMEADDVLAPERQRELEELATRLARWEPDHVAVEAPAEIQSVLDDAYDNYRSGADLENLGEREELVQIGFRLADRLEHDGVVGIDHHVFHRQFPDEYGEEFEAWWNDETTTEELVGRPLTTDDYGSVADEEERRLANATIPEYLAEINRKPRPTESNRYGLLGWEGDDDGVRFLSQWMERNFRMIHNLSRAMDADAERILLIVGAGHVNDLRYVLRRTPFLCPVSPLPYLP